MVAEHGEDAVSGTGSAVPDTSPGVPAVRPAVPRPAVPAAAPVPRRRGRMPSGFASLRDILSFVAGLLVIGNEVFVSDRVEIAILSVGVALLGLPVVFGADERKRKPPAEPPAS